MHALSPRTPPCSFLLLGLVVSACAVADDLPSERDAHSDDVAAQVVTRTPQRPPQSGPTAAPTLPIERLFATVDGVDYEGDLCPPGSMDQNANNDGVFTFRLGAELNDQDGNGASARCTIFLNLTTPAGYQLNRPLLSFASYYFGDSQPVVSATYAYEGASGTHVATITPGIDEPAASMTRPDLWTPSCQRPTEPGKVRLRVDLAASISPGAFGIINFSSFDGAFRFQDGAHFRRCGSTEVVTVPPAGRDGTCGGPHEIGCLRGLACETASREWDALEERAVGKCVSTTARPAAGASGDACGGVNRRACGGGLVCHYKRDELRKPNFTGECKPSVGQRDDTCGGVPSIGCAAELSCIVPEGRTTGSCVSAKGQEGDACGSDVPTPCGPGLTCFGGACQPAAPGSIGGACRTTGPACTTLASCIDGICVEKP